MKSQAAQQNLSGTASAAVDVSQVDRLDEIGEESEKAVDTIDPRYNVIAR